MFETTQPFTLFDYFRVPYTCQNAHAGAEALADVASLRVRADGPALFWYASSFSKSEVRADSYLAAGTPIFGAVLPDAALGSRLTRLGGTWRPESGIRNRRGDQIASIWRRGDGSVFLPFDPNEVIYAYLSERYKSLAGPALGARYDALARRSYYRLRPFLPRATQPRHSSIRSPRARTAAEKDRVARPPARALR